MCIYIHTPGKFYKKLEHNELPPNFIKRLTLWKGTAVISLTRAECSKKEG